MNEFICTGRLTKDIEVREIGNGDNKVANFTVAVDGRKDKNGNKRTDFFDCTAWNGMANTLAKYCHKGDKVLIRGEINIVDYESKNIHDDNGRPVRLKAAKVNVNSVEFLNTKGTVNTSAKNENESSDEDDGDFPF